MSDLSADVYELRKKLQATLEQAQQWQQQYEAQTEEVESAPISPGSKIPDQPVALPAGQTVTPASIRAEVSGLTEVSELQEQLIMARLEIYRLTQALTQEQVSHAKTRANLTNALADAVERISRLKQFPPP